MTESNQYEGPACSQHPDAPHGFNRNASHNAGRHVCDCEGWAPDDQGNNMNYQSNQVPILSTSDMSKLLGFGVSVSFLKGLGITPAIEQHNGTFWAESDVPAVCTAIALHLGRVSATPRQSKGR